MPDADIQRAVDDLIALPTPYLDSFTRSRRTRINSSLPTNKQYSKDCGGPMVYLASPYAHASEQVRIHRFDVACSVSATLMRTGLHVFSPIAHSHPIAMHGLDAVDHGFWLTFDQWFLDRCEEMLVLTIPGWRESKGVTWEIERATARGIPIRYVDEAGTIKEAP